MHISCTLTSHNIDTISIGYLPTKPQRKHGHGRTNTHRNLEMAAPSSSSPTPRTAFISGPIDASNEYFNTHYVSPIAAALAAGDSFIMGPVPGIDTLALHYLLSPPISCPPSRITVYMAHFEYADASRRNHYLSLGVDVKEVTTAGEGTTTRMRDEAMTRESVYDVLRYRSEEEAREYYGVGWWPRVSNTEVNERRRRGDGGLEYRGESVTCGKDGEGMGEGDREGKQKRGWVRSLIGRKG